MKQGIPTTGTIHGEILAYQQDGYETTVTVDSPACFTWLDSATSFTFWSEEGHFTAHKTSAGNRRGGSYWRATRRSRGKLYSFYLGKSSKLTLQRLREATQQILVRSGDVG